MCIYWWQKTAHPTWQAIGTPKSSSLPGFHLHTTSRFEHRTFLWSQGPRRGLYQWMAITLHPTASDILPETRQQSQHNLKLCQNNATLFWRYIACPKSQHTLKLCQSNETLLWGYIACQKVTHTLKCTPSSCVRIMHQLVQALPTPQTPTVHWTDVSKPAGTSLDDSTSAMGPYCRQYKPTLYLCFPWLPNWGTSWWCPNTKKLCLIINALAV
jgi:hypothetical protein